MKRFFLLNLAVILILFSTQTVFAEMFLFYDEDCVHCDELDTYLLQNNYYEKFQIQTFEVRNNPANEAFYIQKATELGYKDLLLPWLVHDKTAYDGKTDIANYLDNLNVQVAETETEDLNADYLTEGDQSLLSKIVSEQSDVENAISIGSANTTTTTANIFKNKKIIILGLGIIIIATLILKLRRRK